MPSLLGTRAVHVSLQFKQTVESMPVVVGFMDNVRSIGLRPGALIQLVKAATAQDSEPIVSASE